MRCAVFGCNSNNKNENLENISFYRFPQDESVCELWLYACCRRDNINPKTARICGKHFHEDDFAPLSKPIDLGSPNTSRRLKRNAIPSLGLLVKMQEKNEQCLPRLTETFTQKWVFLPGNALGQQQQQQQQRHERLILQRLQEPCSSRAETIIQKTTTKAQNRHQPYVKINPITHQSITNTTPQKMKQQQQQPQLIHQPIIEHRPTHDEISLKRIFNTNKPHHQLIQQPILELRPSRSLKMGQIILSQENVHLVCRLCLKSDDFVVDIYQGLGADKDPLPERIYELYAVKVEENDGFPKNICHRCLYLTESFTSFRQNVKLCQEQLQAYFESMMAEESRIQDEIISKQKTFDNCYEGLNGFHGLVPDEKCEITVVDPNQDSESSDDCFSMEDSETDFTNQQKNTTEATNESISKSDNAALFAQNLNDITNEQKNTFLCQYCDMAFTNQINCDEHESRHDAANPFICNFCPFRTINRQVLIHHIKESHDNERPFVCALCNKGFCRRSDLKKHTIVHTGVRPYSCSVCTKSFSRNTNLTKHMRIHNGIKPHVCQKCPRSFTTYADLIRHQRAHTEIKAHRCTKCTASFTRKDKLQKHYISHLRKDSGSSFVDRETLKQTPEIHAFSQNQINDTKKNSTTMADKTFSAKPISNFDNVLSGTQFKKTSASENVFEHKSNLKVHICNICSRSFTRKREFQRHQALHLDCLYKCKQCGKNFNRNDKLLRHEKMHHAEQYNCNQCPMSYTKLEALQMHVKVHGLHATGLPKAESNLQFSNTFPKQTPMALGFYSEIKPEE